MQNPHRYMHAWFMRVYSMAHCVCLFNIGNIELHAYPAPEHVYGMVQVSSESVHDPGVGEGTWLCHYINWKLPWLPKLNYPLESHCLFTLSQHWQLTSKAQNCTRSCTEVRAICKHRLATAAHYYTTGTWPLFLYVWCTSNEIYQMKAVIREPVASHDEFPPQKSRKCQHLLICASIACSLEVLNSHQILIFGLL